MGTFKFLRDYDCVTLENGSSLKDIIRITEATELNPYNEEEFMLLFNQFEEPVVYIDPYEEALSMGETLILNVSSTLAEARHEYLDSSYSLNFKTRR